MDGMTLIREQLTTAERLMGYAASVASSDRPEAVAIKRDLTAVMAAVTIVSIDAYLAIETDALEPRHCRKMNEAIAALHTLLAPFLEAFDRWKAGQIAQQELAAEKAAKDAIAKAMA